MSAERRTRLILTCGIITAILTALILNACTSSSASPRKGPSASASPRPSASASSSPSPSPSPAVPPAGTAGRYQVGQQQMPFTEPAHSGPTGEPLPPRSLVTTIEYPLAQGSATQPATGPRPLILFAPGYQQCAAAYDDLLQTWASAGYLVAAVTFPLTNCQVTKPSEDDLVNQPQDMSFVLSSLLALSDQPSGLLSGQVNPREIAAAGQSDGGDTVAALVGNTCCTDTRVRAAAVLSGAEWPAMPGPYFTRSAPPILFAQGSADTVNFPSASIALYSGDGAGVRYYLNLLGASHLSPYEVRTPAEQVVARVTLAFFNGYILGQAGGPAAMVQAGNAGGIAALASGGHVPRNAG